MKNIVLLTRIRKQAITWIVLPAVIGFGWVLPPIGFLLLICMVGAVGMSFFSGRSWCDWMCPRGAFYDVFFQKFNQGKPVPEWLRSNKLRTFMVGLIFTVLGTQLYFAWGDLYGMGMAFVRLLTITTTVGIILGLTVHSRGWCHICPMGTLASWFGKGKKPLFINSEKCTNCGLCTKACPMGLVPNRDENGQLTDPDCIKCGSCIVACNRKVLSFDQQTKDIKISA